MVWNDILLNRTVTQAELRECLAGLFSVAPDSVVIVRSYDEVANVGQFDILCVLLDITGEYSTLLSIILNRESLLPTDDVRLISEIARLLNCKCLFSDASTDARAMYEVDSKGQIFLTLLDADALGNDRYVINSRRPLEDGEQPSCPR